MSKGQRGNKEVKKPKKDKGSVVVLPGKVPGLPAPVVAATASGQTKKR